MTSERHSTERPLRAKKNGSLVEPHEPHLIKWLTVAGEPVTKVYRSERGMPSLCQSPSEFGKPIVTLENYCKWYGVYILHPDGRVEGVDPGLLNELAEKVGHCLMGDHNYHPRLLNELAKHISGQADHRAVEVAAGRWWYEILDGRIEGQPSIDV